MLKGDKTPLNEAGDASPSVTMEQSPDGSSCASSRWALPNYLAAMSGDKKLREGPNPNHFLLWISDLNRHYLGTIEKRMVNLTVLFKDRLTEGEPGKDQIIDSEFLDKLKRLYEDLDLPKNCVSRDSQSAAESPSSDKNLTEEGTLSIWHYLSSTGGADEKFATAMASITRGSLAVLAGFLLARTTWWMHGTIRQGSGPGRHLPGRRYGKGD